MASTNFTSGTLITSTWLNGVDEKVYGVKSAGAIGNGVANDLTAFTTALASGGYVKVPAGTYRIEFTTTDALTTIANTIIEGEGADQTEIVFVPSAATYRNLITMGGDNLTVRNIKISFVPAGFASVAFFNVQRSGLTIENCIIDGSMTDDGVTTSHTAFGFSYPTSGTQNDFKLINSDVLRFNRAFLKTNTSTSTQRRMTMCNNNFYDCYIASLTLNSPAGICDFVTISGNKFYYTGAITPGLPSGSYGHLALASVTNCTVENNMFSGSCIEAMHVEEGCYGLAVTGNIFEVDAIGLSILDNDIAGTPLMPKWISVTGNVFRKSGTLKAAGKHGIWLILDASSEVPAKAVTITGNVIYGFASGIYTDTEVADGVVISDNLADECEYGYHIANHCPQIKDNVSRKCTIDIYSVVAGWVENHSFVDPTTPVDATSLPIVLINPSFSYSPISITGGVTSYRALLTTGANDRIYGLVHFNAFTDVTSDFSHRSFETTWDGTTFTATQKLSRQPGGLSVSAVQNSGNLALSLFCASNRTVRVTAHISGMISVAV